MQSEFYQLYNRQLYRQDSIEPQSENLGQSSASTMPDYQGVFVSVSEFDGSGGKATGVKEMVEGEMFSSNFVSGVSGWKISADGSAEFNEGVTAKELNIPDEDTTANSFHVDEDGNAWWGCTVSDFTSSNDNATAYILATGAAKFQNVSLSGSVSISGIANNTSTDIGLLSFSHDIVFSSTDADTVSWSSGTITMSNGRQFSISAGNTGNMSAKTLVYLDSGVSSTVLQTTTSPSTAIGANKILIAIAEDDSSGAVFQVTTGIGGMAINEDSILVDTIAAIKADLGAITAGTITLNTSGYIKGGQTGYDTGTGFFLGYSGGAYKFSIGTPGTASLTWDGTTLSASNMELAYPFTAKEAITAGDAVAIIPPAGVRDTALASDNGASTGAASASAAYDIVPGWAVVFKTTANASGISYIDAGSGPVTMQTSDGSHPSSGAAYGVWAWDNTNKKATGSSLIYGNMSGSKPFFYFPNSGIIPVNKNVTANSYYCLRVIPKSWSSGVSGGSHGYRIGGAPSGSAEDPTLWFTNQAGEVHTQVSGDPEFAFMEKVYGSDAGQLVKASAVDALDGRYLGYIGIAKENIAAAGVGDVKTFGISSAESGLTIGSDYYLSDTLGDISTSAGTTSKVVGKALTTSLLLLQ